MNQYQSINTSPSKSINRRFQTYIVTDTKGMEQARKLGERHKVVWGLAVVFFVASLAMGLKVLPVMDEDFSDIMYFFVVTLSTVGYGDVVVDNEPAMVFMICYSFFGLLLAAAIIGILSVQSVHRREQRRLENESHMDGKHLGLFVDDDGEEEEDASLTGFNLRQNYRNWCGRQHTSEQMFDPRSQSSFSLLSKTKSCLFASCASTF
jgi:hypothetical protein